MPLLSVHIFEPSGELSEPNLEDCSPTLEPGLKASLVLHGPGPRLVLLEPSLVILDPILEAEFGLQHVVRVEAEELLWCPWCLEKKNAKINNKYEILRNINEMGKTVYIQR